MRTLLKPLPQSVQLSVLLQLKSATQAVPERADPAGQLRHWVGRLSAQVTQGDWQLRTQTPFELAVYPGTQAEQEELLLHVRHLAPQGMHLDFER